MDLALLASDGFCEGVIGGGWVQSVGQLVFDELGPNVPAYLASLISVRVLILGKGKYLSYAAVV